MLRVGGGDVEVQGGPQTSLRMDGNVTRLSVAGSFFSFFHLILGGFSSFFFFFPLDFGFVLFSSVDFHEIFLRASGRS